MDMQSEHSPTCPSEPSLLDSSAGRGGAISSAAVARGSSSGNTCGATSLDSTSSGGVYNLARRPKRPWDDTSLAGNETSATACMSKQPTMSGVGGASSDGAATGAKEACGGGTFATEGGGTSKGGVAIDLVDSPSIVAPSIHSKGTAGSGNSSSTSDMSVLRGGGNGSSEDGLTDPDEKSVSTSRIPYHMQ